MKPNSIFVVVVTLFVCAGCAQREGVCSGMQSGVPQNGAVDGCDLELRDCGPDGSLLRAACDDDGECHCFDNGNPASDFTSAAFCDSVRADLDGDDGAAATLRSLVSSGCGFDGDEG